MGQETLTVVAHVDEPARALAALSSFRATSLADARLGIHFARLLLVPGRADLPPSLVLESNFDSDARGGNGTAHVKALSEFAGGPLADVFESSADFPHGEGSAGLERFFVAHLVPATASYQGHADRDLERIAMEKHLREVILTFLETARPAPPLELFRRIRRYVREVAPSELPGLDLDAPAPALPDAVARQEKLDEKWEPWLVNSRPSWPILPGLPRVVGWQETDAVFDQRARQEAWTAGDRQRFREVARTEDRGMQNALTHVVPLRAGLGREGILRSAHAYIDRMSQRYFRDIGQLGGIPSIHFAKWLLIDRGARLLFLSNYDGSWESYLGDFVDQAAMGLNLAWSCTEEYPKTSLLAFDGASDEETFKAWGRAYQVPTQVFYSAYPDLSIATINNNTWIRKRLHDPADHGDLEAWLRRLT